MRIPRSGQLSTLGDKLEKGKSIQRLWPKKNSASIPGPTWAPVKGSWGQIISSFGGQMSRTISASRSASSGQSPWVMATRWVSG